MVDEGRVYCRPLPPKRALIVVDNGFAAGQVILSVDGRCVGEPINELSAAVPQYRTAMRQMVVCRCRRLEAAFPLPRPEWRTSVLGEAAPPKWTSDYPCVTI